MTVASNQTTYARSQSLSRALWVTFFVALTVRLLFCFVAIPVLGLNLGPARSDFHSSTDGYTTLAVNLINHGVYAFAPDAPPTSYRGPAFPAALAVFYAAIGNIDIAVLLVNCLSSAATCVFVLLIARQLFGTRVNGWWALPVIIFPLSIYYCANAFSDTFLAFTVVGYIWSTIRLLQQPTHGNALLVAICFTLAALTKAVVLPIPLLLVAFTLLIKRPALKPAVVATVVGFALTGVWTARNYIVTNEFTPVTGGTGFNMLLGTYMIEESHDCDRSMKHGRQRALDYFASTGEPIELDRLETNGHLDVPKDIDQRYGAIAVDMFKTDPMLVVKKLGVGAVRFWYFSSSPTKSLANAVVNGGVLLLALVGLFVVPTDHRMAAIWLALFTLAFVFLYALIIIHSSRFSLPIVMALLPLATGPVAALVGKRTNTNNAESRQSADVLSTNAEGLQS